MPPEKNNLILEKRIKLFSDDSQGFSDLILHSFNRDLQLCGYLFVRHILKTAHQEDSPALRREFIDGHIQGFLEIPGYQFMEDILIILVCGL